MSMAVHLYLSEQVLPGERAVQAAADSPPTLGPLGSSSSQHRRPPELILRKGRASFRITSGPPSQKDRGRNGLKGILIGHVKVPKRNELSHIDSE